MRTVSIIWMAIVLVLAAPGLAFSADTCPNGRSADAAMWLSIAHPGLGEYHLKGWGDFSKMPEKKFWMGFIPFFGWPGYLQVKSAIDAKNCRTNDEIYFRE